MTCRYFFSQSAINLRTWESTHGSSWCRHRPKSLGCNWWIQGNIYRKHLQETHGSMRCLRGALIKGVLCFLPSCAGIFVHQKPSVQLIWGAVDLQHRMVVADLVMDTMPNWSQHASMLHLIPFILSCTWRAKARQVTGPSGNTQLYIRTIDYCSRLRHNWFLVPFLGATNAFHKIRCPKVRGTRNSSKIRPFGSWSPWFWRSKPSPLTIFVHPKGHDPCRHPQNIFGPSWSVVVLENTILSGQVDLEWILWSGTSVLVKHGS